MVSTYNIVLGYFTLGVCVLLVSSAALNNASAQKSKTSPVATTKTKSPKPGIFFINVTPMPKTTRSSEGRTDVPEEMEIGEDPTTSASGLTQRTESPYGTDPIEQHDAMSTPTPVQKPKVQKQIVKPQQLKQQIPKPQQLQQQVVKSQQLKVQRHIFKPQSKFMFPMMLTPRPILTRRPDPIVHARPPPPSTPKPTEAEQETEVKGPATSSYYYDSYTSEQKRNITNPRSGGSMGGDTCPVFTESIMEHHVILRRGGCELIFSQDDVLRYVGRPIYEQAVYDKLPKPNNKSCILV